MGEGSRGWGLRWERWRLAGWLGGVLAAAGYQRMFGVLPVGGGTPPGQPARRQRSDALPRNRAFDIFRA